VPQYFKGDATELKYYAVGSSVIQGFNLSKDDFFDDAYACFVLGELLYDNGLSPLANAIPRDIFIGSFADIFDAFVEAGSFEGYLTVFRKIFGEDVVVEFVVPAPGKLQINIEATGVEEFLFAARQIENDEYVLYDILDDENDNIVFQTLKGFESQYELEQMLFEMVPAGIFTEITLTLP
jgi:hypothetical protein